MDDIDVEESVAYLHEAESRYLAAKDRITLWLQSNTNSLWRREIDQMSTQMIP